MKEEYLELVELATNLLDKRYNPPVHTVASALRTKSGEIFTGINIDHFSAYVCAETAALSDAINRKEYEFDLVVAVRKDAEGNTVIANMCGKCRQIFHDYAPEINVVISDGNAVMTKSINEILPFAFTRQREKIQSVIEGMKV